MKKTLTIGVGATLLLIVAGFLYLIALNGRYEVNANQLVKVDKWTGEVWLYNSLNNEWAVSNKENKNEWIAPEIKEAMKKEQWEPPEYKDAIANEMAFFDPKRPHSKKSFYEEDRKKLIEMDYWALIENDPEFQKISDAQKEKVRRGWTEYLWSALNSVPNDYILMNIKRAQIELLKRTPENTKLIHDENEKIKSFIGLTSQTESKF